MSPFGFRWVLSEITAMLPGLGQVKVFFILILAQMRDGENLREMAAISARRTYLTY